VFLSHRSAKIQVPFRGGGGGGGGIKYKRRLELFVLAFLTSILCGQQLQAMNLEYTQFSLHLLIFFSFTSVLFCSSFSPKGSPPSPSVPNFDNNVYFFFLENFFLFKFDELTSATVSP